MKKGIEVVENPIWTWIVNHDFSEEKQNILNEEFDKEFHGNIGKYLFFSINKKELIELAELALKKHDLHRAKTSTKLGDKNTEHVLCVYDSGPNLVQEMKQYATDTIKYRYWKSDEATLKGVKQDSL